MKAALPVGPSWLSSRAVLTRIGRLWSSRCRYAQTGLMIVLLRTRLKGPKQLLEHNDYALQSDEQFDLGQVSV